MNIDLGDFVITSDPHNIILNTKKVTKEGKNVGTAYLVPISYHSNLLSLVDKLLNQVVLQSDVTTLTEIKDLLSQTTLTICKSIREV